MDRSLWDALGEVPDRRGRQGRHYPLRSVLGISLAAILAGANDLRAIFRWGRRLRPEALRLFGIESGRAPCHATYHYFFRALDADALAATTGVFDLAKAASQAWAAGHKVYWDDTNKVATKTASGNTAVGVAVAAVTGGAADTIGRVRLNGAF